MAKFSIDLPADAAKLYRSANGSELKDALEYHALSWLASAKGVLIARSVDDKDAAVAAEIIKTENKQLST